MPTTTDVIAMPTTDMAVGPADLNAARLAVRGAGDLNAARKKREGRIDQGLCPCKIYVAGSCKTYCLKSGERHS